MQVLPVLEALLEIRLHQMLAKEAMHNAIHMSCAQASLTRFLQCFEPPVAETCGTALIGPCPDLRLR